MRRYLVQSLFVAAVGLGLVSGCSHCCRRPSCTGCTASPASLAPLPGAGLAPPPAAPSEAFNPPAPAMPQTPPPPAGVPDTRYSPLPPAPAENPAWQPSESGVQLRAPEPFTAAKPAETAQLRPPEVTETVEPSTPPRVQQQPPAAIQPRPQPPPQVKEERPPANPMAPPPELPVGIPQFEMAKERVATGLRPALDDGLDWLQAKGYRTVLHVRRPGEDDAADRKQVEKRGLRYVSIEVSPQTLTRQVVDQFNRVVGDAAGYPLFVYDRNGSLAGGLWYLHYRTAEGATDELARVRAAALGLREEREGHREMWVAIRTFLNQGQPPRP